MRVVELFENPRVAQVLPRRVVQQLELWADHLQVLIEVRNPSVVRQVLPSAVRGLFLRVGRSGEPTRMRAHHDAWFDWQYEADNAEMQSLYQKAKRLQWNAATDIDWSIDVDPLRTDRAILPMDFLNWSILEGHGVRLNEGERRIALHQAVAWMLSQFLHGEQGALMASAQVTESVPWTDGKYYGATQVMDEARHVEVFHRYLDTKMSKLYDVNDNLFTIIDSLMVDSRWDMKFLGMQIMVEGLALGAFGMLHKVTHEPLLKEILRRVIHDEARHVNYGVLALRKHFNENLTERERNEREDWAFEVAMLMRNRFLAHELYDEHYAHAMSRRQWNDFVGQSKGLNLFRTVMFTRLVPNLREIGLLSPRILPHYERVGLARYMNGLSARQLDGDALIEDRSAA